MRGLMTTVFSALFVWMVAPGVAAQETEPYTAPPSASSTGASQTTGDADASAAAVAADKARREAAERARHEAAQTARRESAKRARRRLAYQDVPNGDSGTTRGDPSSGMSDRIWRLGRYDTTGTEQKVAASVSQEDWVKDAGQFWALFLASGNPYAAAMRFHWPITHYPSANAVRPPLIEPLDPNSPDSVIDYLQPVFVY